MFLKLKAMKTLFDNLFFAVLVLGLMSCSATRQAGVSYETDDIYFSSSDRAEEQFNQSQNNQRVAEENYTSPSENDEYYTPAEDRPQTESYTDQNGNVTNNYYGDYYESNSGYDDYYDYAYSSRIRRFHRPVATFSYYDPFYTNSYWYDYNPYNYGSSIYLGYNWWTPNVSVGFGWGWGNTYYDNCWGGWGGYGYSWPRYRNYGYAGWGGGYWNGGYNRGYNHGYWNGYRDGRFASNYFNSYDNNSYFYGKRSATTSNGVRRGTVGDTYQRALGERAYKASTNDRLERVNKTRSNAKKAEYGTINSERRAVRSTPAKVGDTRTIDRDRYGKTTTPTRRTESTYTKPVPRENVEMKQYGTRRPSTNTKYTQSSEKANKIKRPSTYDNSVIGTPERRSSNYNNVKSVSPSKSPRTPRRSVKSYSTPSKTTPSKSGSYSSPSRSTRSYSSPSRSSGSYSSPSRSVSPSRPASPSPSRRSPR